VAQERSNEQVLVLAVAATHEARVKCGLSRRRVGAPDVAIGTPAELPIVKDEDGALRVIGLIDVHVSAAAYVELAAAKQVDVSAQSHDRAGRRGVDRERDGASQDVLGHGSQRSVGAGQELTMSLVTAAPPKNCNTVAELLTTMAFVFVGREAGQQQAHIRRAMSDA
jgi:hypothetical protein